MKKIILIWGLFAMYEIATAQDLDKEQYIYWQADRKLTHTDFNGAVGGCGEILLDSIELEAAACLAIWSILDLPKNGKPGLDYERFYFAPIFDKSKSWIKTNDSIEILKQQVFLI